MKSKSDVEKRLSKLRLQYTRKYVAKSQQRLHRNCVHNYEHTYTPPKQSSTADASLVPRRQVTLVVIQPDSPVRLCMYGSDDPANWPGNTCDRDEIASSCKMFKARTPPEAARDEFLGLMADDEYVFDNYRDMAALQWVLEDRIHRKSLTWWEKLILWIQCLLTRNKALPAAEVPELPENIWNDDVK